MRQTGAANDAVTRHLLEAIERVRDDVAKVEFWADAVAGFSRPVPDYEADGASVWLPAEQAHTLNSKLRASRPGRGTSGNKNGKTSPSKRRASLRDKPRR
jgi:hypothetical protein